MENPDQEVGQAEDTNIVENQDLLQGSEVQNEQEQNLTEGDDGEESLTHDSEPIDNIGVTRINDIDSTENSFQESAHFESSDHEPMDTSNLAELDSENLIAASLSGNLSSESLNYEESQNLKEDMENTETEQSAVDNTFEDTTSAGGDLLCSASQPIENDSQKNVEDSNENPPKSDGSVANTLDANKSNTDKLAESSIEQDKNEQSEQNSEPQTVHKDVEDIEKPLGDSIGNIPMETDDSATLPVLETPEKTNTSNTQSNEMPGPSNAELPQLSDESGNELHQPVVNSSVPAIPVNADVRSTEPPDNNFGILAAATDPIILQRLDRSVGLTPPVKSEPPEAEEEADKSKRPEIDSDALTTLASAALSVNQAPTTPVKEEPKPLAPPKRNDQWFDVGLIKGTQCTVTSFFMSPDGNDITLSNGAPDYNIMKKISLEPGTAYKFRVCGINSCGRGPWSEIAAFKTSLPGFPGAPSAIKITKSSEGAHLSWEPPQFTAGEFTEFAVYLGVREADSKMTSGSSMEFVRIYSGLENQCTVTAETLAMAHIDSKATKPAILFRIACRNEKGYGPATQVRWLQDMSTHSKAQPGIKRIPDMKQNISPVKKFRPDDM